MKILCVCNRGVSRAPTIAALLTNAGHETLAVGAYTTSEDTRKMLADWCDLAIFTSAIQGAEFPEIANSQVWPIEDVYPRPFNKDLRSLVLRMIAQKGL